MSKIKSKTIVFTALLLFAVSAMAQPGTNTTPERPKSYTVQQGDTLWDIAETFLFAPWLWKEIWHTNPAIKNPDLIYPGDIVYLADIKGRLSLKLMRGSTVKLSPHMRSAPISEAIKGIPIGAIHQFLTRPNVIEDDADKRPYVVAFENNRLLSGPNDRFYARGTLEDNQLLYNIIRPGDVYIHGESGVELGREGLWIGEAALIKTGDPHTFLVKEANREIVVGDRLYPVSEEYSTQTFYPKTPDTEIHGTIISVLNGVRQIGQYSLVVIDQGEDQGLKVGDVLQINHTGATIRDKVSKEVFDEIVLPSEKTAILMVFRTFPKVSFALVMHTKKALHVGDKVQNPDAEEE